MTSLEKTNFGWHLARGVSHCRFHFILHIVTAYLILVMYICSMFDKTPHRSRMAPVGSVDEGGPAVLQHIQDTKTVMIG